MAVSIKRILVPVDFSEPCIQSLDYAKSLAKLYGAELDLVHVVERVAYEINAPADFVITAPGVPLLDPEKLKADAKKELDMFANRHGLERCVTEARYGHPAKELLAACAKLKPDLIVLSTHGRTGLSRFVLGSVAEQMVRLAPCPTLCVRMPPG
jgi:nucleotide-binding universal stress UspA family protein